AVQNQAQWQRPALLVTRGQNGRIRYSLRGEVNRQPCYVNTGVFHARTMLTIKGDSQGSPAAVFGLSRKFSQRKQGARGRVRFQRQPTVFWIKPEHRDKVTRVHGLVKL